MWTFQTTRADVNLSIAVQGFGHYCDSFAGGYAVIIEDLDIEVWGYGGYRNTETFYTVGTSHALTEALPFVNPEDFSCHVWAETKAYIDNLKANFPVWLSRGALTARGTRPDAYEESEYLYLILQRGQLQVDRLTPKDWPPALRRCEKYAAQLAQLAFEKKACKQIGIVHAGTFFANIV